MKTILIFSILSIISFQINSQKISDSISKPKNKYQYKKWILPASMVTYGFVALSNSQLKSLNTTINNSIIKNENKKTSVDDFLQYVPFTAVYGLNAIGIKNNRTLKEKTITLATAYILMGISVNGLKRITSIERPDRSARNAFPSGHTATAFMGAEYLYQQYKDKSLIYGITGYIIASGVGVLRMYNNRHWFNDVVAGAGFGILSTKIAYLLQPYIKRKLLKKNNKEFNTAFAPNIVDGKIGFLLRHNF